MPPARRPRAEPTPEPATLPESAPAAPNPAVIPPSVRSAADLIRLAGDPTRLYILDRLRSGPLGAVDLAAGSPSAPKVVAQNLAKLRASGAIEPNHLGRFVVYELTQLGRMLVELAWRMGDAIAAEFPR